VDGGPVDAVPGFFDYFSVISTPVADKGMLANDDQIE
jgi:hypothetical protein